MGLQPHNMALNKRTSWIFQEIMGKFQRRKNTLKFLWHVLIIFGAMSCVTPSERASPPLALDQIVKLIPARVPDREGWAKDVAAAITATNLEPTAERVCAVLSVIEQESNYQVDPVVRDLAKIVREGMLKKLDRLGPLANPALDVLLSGKPPHSNETFASRVDRLRTEKDLDRFFREMAAAYRDKFPGSFVIASALSKLLGKKGISELNPVTTAGSMQVKVDFVRTLPEFRRLDDGEVRELLYTRAGGIRGGAARLLGYKASYDKIIYRFADYNVGVYSSRNAAFQKLLSDLTGQELALDGDLLAYDDDGYPNGVETQSLKAMNTFAKANDMWMWPVRRAARKEKLLDFEDTSIWKKTREAWKNKNGKVPEYARIPTVTLVSPKLSRDRSTEWFAKSVEKRYENCR
jgi:hypothetical protein